MKVIFLDFDGVLNTPAHCSKPDYYKDPCDTPHVEVLNEVIARTGAKVVISSVWRMDGMEKCIDHLTRKGFKGQVIGVTTSHPKTGDTRGHEIQEWLDMQQTTANALGGEAKQRQTVEKFVIIDDDSDMTGVEKWHVHITNNTGLMHSHVPQILRHIG